LEIIKNMAENNFKSVLVLHGPNLNLLGLREPNHYGNNTLADIDSLMAKRAKEANMNLQSFQSNSEVELIQRLHDVANGSADKKVDFIIINPAAFTHTSVALRDALSAIKVPFVEVHLSNIYARETFRHHSYFSDIAVGVISGLGAQGYLLALDYAIQTIAD
jgi:3-dehydroquinate dehydratase-2